MSEDLNIDMYNIQKKSLIVEESQLMKFSKFNESNGSQDLKGLDLNNLNFGNKNDYYSHFHEISTKDDLASLFTIPESLILSQNILYELKDKKKPKKPSKKAKANNQTKRTFLVKYIHKDKKTIIYMKFFKNVSLQRSEFEIANLLQDIEGVVKIYGNQEFGTSPIILMEAGQCDLNDLLKIRKKHNKFYLEHEVIYILKELTKIFAQIHKKGVVHSDIKLHNIIYDNGCYLVIDFGISHKIDEEWKQRGYTHFYAPPEIFLENAVSDQSTDVYCLGIMALELLGIEIPKTSDSLTNKDYKDRATKILEKLDNLKEFPFLIPILKQMVCIEPKGRLSMKKINDILEESKQCEQPNESLFVKKIQEKEIHIYEGAICPNESDFDSLIEKEKVKCFPLIKKQKNDKKIFENISNMPEIINKKNVSQIMELLKKTFNKQDKNMELYLNIYESYIKEDFKKIEKILKEKNESSEELEIKNKIIIKILLLCFIVINNRSNDEKEKYENELNLALKQYKKKFIFTNFFKLNLTRWYTKMTLDLDKQELVCNMKNIPLEKYPVFLEILSKLNSLLFNNSVLAWKITNTSNLDLKFVFDFLIISFYYDKFGLSSEIKIFEVIFIEGIIDYKKAEHEHKYLTKFEISKKEFLLLYSRKRMKYLISRNMLTHKFSPLAHDNYFIASAYLSYGELCLEYGKYEENYRREVEPSFHKFYNLILFLMRKKDDVNVEKSISERLNKILKHRNDFTYSELKDPSILIAKIECLEKIWELIQRKGISLLEKKIEIDDKMRDEEEYIYFLLKRCIFYEIYLDSNPFFEYLLQKNIIVKFIDKTLSCENYCYTFDCWKYLFVNQKIDLLSISFENFLAKHNSFHFTFFSLAYFIKYNEIRETFRNFCLNFAFSSAIPGHAKPNLVQEMEEFIERFLIE